MAQVSYDTLFPQCMVELPGVPAILLTNALNNAAVTLCKRSACWKAWQDITLVAGVSAYEVELPSAGARLDSILQVSLSGYALTPTSNEALTEELPGYVDYSGTPSSFFINDDGELVVSPTPGDADAGLILKVRASFVPALLSAGLESRLIDRYGMALCAGAKAELMRMPGKEWGNPPMSAYYENEFKRAVDEAVIDQSHGTINGISLSVTGRAFGSRP
jgi:hypothetical protein